MMLLDYPALKPYFFRGSDEDWAGMSSEQQQACVANYVAAQRKHKPCPTCHGEGFVVDEDDTDFDIGYASEEGDDVEQPQ